MSAVITGYDYAQPVTQNCDCAKDFRLIKARVDNLEAKVRELMSHERKLTVENKKLREIIGRNLIL